METMVDDNDNVNVNGGDSAVKTNGSHAPQHDPQDRMNGSTTAAKAKANCKKTVQFAYDDANMNGVHGDDNDDHHEDDKNSNTSSSDTDQSLLAELGFEFRFVPCPIHEHNHRSSTSAINIDENNGHNSNGNGPDNEHASTSASTITPYSSSVPPISLAETSRCQSGKCSTRLFHNEDEMMTFETYPLQDHIPKGPIFDQVHKRAQLYTQSKLCEDFHMHHIPLFGDDVHALVSDSLIRDPSTEDDDHEVDADADADDDEEGQDNEEDEDEDGSISYSKMKQRRYSSTWAQSQRKRHYQQRKNTLIVIGGKGISRCGLVSVRQLLGAGIERGSCAYHIQTALQRKWHVIVLDPNAEGKWTPRGGFDVITKSLDRLLFMDSRPESISSRIMGMDDDDSDDSDSDDSEDDDNDDNDEKKNTSTTKKKPNLYFFCHSAAGGHIVRYLLDQTVNFQRRIAKLCFSDSTHRLSWADPDEHKYLHNVLLQDPQYALYIRNNSLGRDYPLYKTPMPGDDCGDTVDHWWIHRYGNLRTVWAGTSDHSLMVFEARKVVWDFFDNKPTDHSQSNENGRRSSDALDLAQAEKEHSSRRSFLRKSTAHF